MNIYYVYQYLREDLTPYYIGKGKESRLFGKHRCRVPKNKNLIQIIANNLTESEAHTLERKLIAQYGRKDLGTGILRNLTDGGKGTSGYKHTAISKQKCGDPSRGKVAHNKGKSQVHKKHKPRCDNGHKRLSYKDRDVIGKWETGFMMKVTCEHCSRPFDKGNYARYHGDKCKLK